MMYMAVDQYGTTVHGLEYPRRDLQRQFGGRARKMYQDKKDGTMVHVGYIVGKQWFTLYKVERMERSA